MSVIHLFLNEKVDKWSLPISTLANFNCARIKQYGSVVDKNITNAADESRLSQKKTNLSFIVEIQIKCHIFDIIIHTDVGSRDLYELARISAHWSKI
jgi:hypothetical protein